MRGGGCRALRGGARGRVPGHQLRAERAAPAAGRASDRNVVVVGDDDQSIYRFRGASRKNIHDFQETLPGCEGDPAGGQLPLQPADPRRRARGRRAERRAAAEEAAAPRAPRRRVAASTPVSFWRCENERAQAQAVAAELERLIADGVDPATCAVLVRSVRNEGQLVATALEERGDPLPAGRRGGVLRARRGARPARVAAPAVRSQRRARGRARAAAAAGRAEPGRPGARDPDRAPAQDRHGLGARAALETPEVPPEARERMETLPAPVPQRLARVRGDAAGPVRAPADRADRPAQAVPVQRQHRVARAAREHRQVRRPRGRLGAARAGPQLARLRRLRERRRAGRPARGGGDACAPTRAPSR